MKQLKPPSDTITYRSFMIGMLFLFIGTVLILFDMLMSAKVFVCIGAFFGYVAAVSLFVHQMLLRDYLDEYRKQVERRRRDGQKVSGEGVCPTEND